MKSRRFEVSLKQLALLAVLLVCQWPVLGADAVDAPEAQSESNELANAAILELTQDDNIQ